MAILKPEQQVFLDKVTVADEAWREAKANSLARAKVNADLEVAQYALRRDEAIRMALNAEVPKRQMLQKHAGLHSTSPSTLAESLARTAIVAAEEAKRAPVDPMAAHVAYNAEDGDFTVTDAEGTSIRLMRDGDFSAADDSIPTAEWHAWRRANRDEISRYMGVVGQ